MAKVNFDIKKGDTFSKNVALKNKKTQIPVDLAGAVVSGEIKKGTVTVPFTSSMIASAEGKFKFGLDETVTAGLSVGKWVHSVRITYADTTVRTIFEGNFVVYA